MKHLSLFVIINSLYLGFTYLAYSATSTDKNPTKYTCVNLTKLMQFGYKDTKNSNDVYKLRNFLKEDRDFISNKIDPAGYFGNNTKTAVIVFQNKHNIIGTGVVGQVTRAKISEVSCSTQSSYTDKKIPISKTTTNLVGKLISSTENVSQVNKNIPAILESPTIFAKTLLATEITSNSATLNGSGGVDGEKHWFEWGKEIGFGKMTPELVTSVVYSTKITGLTPLTTYYFRAVTSVATTTERNAEIAYGPIRYFTTPAASSGSIIIPTISISSPQTAVNSIGSTKVIWSSTNATICHFTGGEEGGGWTSQTSLSGVYVTKPMAKEATFGIYCTSSSGNTVTASILVSKVSN